MFYINFDTQKKNYYTTLTLNGKVLFQKIQILNNIFTGMFFDIIIVLFFFKFIVLFKNEINKFDLCIYDECHNINQKNEKRNHLLNVKQKCLFLTATPTKEQQKIMNEKNDNKFGINN